MKNKIENPKLLRCNSCKYCANSIYSSGLRCLHPAVNIRNVGYLAGDCEAARDCQDERKNSYFSKCGVAGRLWSPVRPGEEKKYR